MRQHISGMPFAALTAVVVVLLFVTVTPTEAKVLRLRQGEPAPSQCRLVRSEQYPGGGQAQNIYTRADIVTVALSMDNAWYVTKFFLSFES